MTSGVGVTLRAVSGTGPGDVYAVDDGGTALHYGGTSWSPMVTPTTRALAGVFAAAPNDAYALTASGSLLHFDGSRWAFEPTGHMPSMSTLAAIWGTGPGDVFAVGSGVVWHRDRTGWSRVALVGSPLLRGVHGSWGGEVLAVGASGAVLRFRGVD